MKITCLAGEINSADIYSSPELFAAMWPKLLKASAVEALRLKRKEAADPVTADAVEEFLHTAGNGSETRVDVAHRISLVRRENDRTIATESHDPQGWIHRSIINK